MCSVWGARRTGLKTTALKQCWQHSCVIFWSQLLAPDAQYQDLTSLINPCEACSEWNLSSTILGSSTITTSASIRNLGVIFNDLQRAQSSFPAISSTWLHRYYLNWTELDNAITKFNNEMHSADNWVLNPVILHYWHNLPIVILCSAFVTICIVKSAI